MGKNLIQQARGKGGPRYRVPSFRFIGASKLRPITASTVTGTIIDLHDCPGHSAPMMEIAYEDGVRCTMIAPEGIKVGDTVTAGPTGTIIIGNILPLKEIP